MKTAAKAVRARPGRQGSLRRPRERPASATQGETARAPRDVIERGSGWETRLCELELRLTQLESENGRLRSTVQQLEAKNETLAEVCDFPGAGLLTLNSRGMILDINRAGASLLGATPRQLLKRSFSALVQAADRAAFKSHLARCRASRSAVVDILHLRHVGGHSIVVQLSSRGLREGKPQLMLIKTTLLDVRERQQAEAALLVSERNLRALIDASPHPIQYKDGKGRWLLANPAMLGLFGLTGRDYHGKHDVELAAMAGRFGAALEKHRQKDEAAMASGRTTRQDETIQLLDGVERVIDFIKVPLRETDGQLKGLLTLGYDITQRQQDAQRVRELNRDLQRHAAELEERVRERTALLNRTNTQLRSEIKAHEHAERALSENRSRLEAIMNHSPALIFLKDTQGRYLHFNQRFEDYMKLRLEQAVGKTDHELFPPEIAAVFRNNDLAVVAAGKPIVFDEVVTHGGGTYTNIVTKFPLFDADGKVYAIGGIVTDITERKRLEEEILQISEREQRRIAQDLHDGLGQQLTGIWCLAEVLRKNISAGTAPRPSEITRVTKMLKSAVEQSRSLARGLHPVEAEPTGLMSALEGLAARASSLFSVDCALDCPLPVVIHDQAAATQLYRIAQEAVTNSIKHGRAKKISIALSAAAELIILSVGDDGVGFQKNLSRPRGLGMRIMSHRAGLIGGTLMVQKKLEGGVKVVCAVGKNVAAGSQPNHEQKNTKT